jgi:outer membrane protein TolC
LALALSLSGSARAAEPVALDVLEAYQLALSHDRRFQAVKAQMRSEREALPQAESRMRPSVSLTANRSRIDQSRDDSLGSVLRQRYNSDQDVMSLRQPVYSPKLLDAKGQAQAQVLAAEAGVEAERLNLLGRVSEA